jgi:hypothetical protein
MEKDMVVKYIDVIVALNAPEKEQDLALLQHILDRLHGSSRTTLYDEETKLFMQLFLRLHSMFSLAERKKQKQLAENAGNADVNDEHASGPSTSIVPSTPNEIGQHFMSQDANIRSQVDLEQDAADLPALAELPGPSVDRVFYKVFLLAPEEKAKNPISFEVFRDIFVKMARQARAAEDFYGVAYNAA